MRPEHMMSFPEEYPELLEQIGQVIYNRLVNHDMASGQATSLTFEITEAIRTEIGGVSNTFRAGFPTSFPSAIRKSGTSSTAATTRRSPTSTTSPKCRCATS